MAASYTDPPPPRDRRATISACVITLNEERRLPRCLASLSLCDEVVVVDSGSTDRTVSIARDAGAKVIANRWPGYAAQRNLAVAHATGDWILEVDADEWLSPELQDELVRFLREHCDQYEIGVIPLREHFLGRTLGPSSHYPYYRPRLFRRGAYSHEESRTVHEGLHPRTVPWIFESDLHHDLAGTLREALDDAHAYSSLEARRLAAVAPSAYFAGIAVRPLAKFVYQVGALGGWRDGWRGVLKTAIDCGADVEVWVRRLRRGSVVTEEGSQLDSRHYGRRRDRIGPIRLAVIGGRGSAERPEVRGWLEEVVRRGIWVTVIGPVAPEPRGRLLRHHAVSRIRPVPLMRALDAERQLGPFDAAIALDRRAESVVRMIPGTVRSYSPVLRVGEAAAGVLEGLRQAS